MKLLRYKIIFLVAFCYAQEQYASQIDTSQYHAEMNQAIQSIKRSFFKPNEDPIVDVRFIGDALIAKCGMGKHDHFLYETVVELRRLYYEERTSQQPNQHNIDLYLTGIVALLEENKIIANRCYVTVVRQKKFSQDYWAALRR